ncbi:disease resistance protein [Quercus suber]|uniref:Disease resistance protein n=1 Tax=Quercus suber TaxID=58331 RepID=A0AAW0JMB3_QUESU
MERNDCVREDKSNCKRMLRITSSHHHSGSCYEKKDKGLAMGRCLKRVAKDSCLLEDGSKKGTVKMHDVVHDVAIWKLVPMSNPSNPTSLRRFSTR